VNTTPRPRWDQRRFVSLAVLFSGLALPITGLGDHLATDSSGPHAGFGWVVAHVAVGSLFVVFATWHAVLNRRALLKYLRSKAARPARPSLEALAALALVGGTVALTVGR
jgi:heme exporter protein D